MATSSARQMRTTEGRVDKRLHPLLLFVLIDESDFEGRNEIAIEHWVVAIDHSGAASIQSIERECGFRPPARYI